MCGGAREHLGPVFEMNAYAYTHANATAAAAAADGTGGNGDGDAEAASASASVTSSVTPSVTSSVALSPLAHLPAVATRHFPLFFLLLSHAALHLETRVLATVFEHHNALWPPGGNGGNGGNGNGGNNKAGNGSSVGGGKGVCVGVSAVAFAHETRAAPDLLRSTAHCLLQRYAEMNAFAMTPLLRTLRRDTSDGNGDDNDNGNGNGNGNDNDNDNDNGNDNGGYSDVDSDGDAHRTKTVAAVAAEIVRMRGELGDVFSRGGDRR
jgi:hypothetical protein